MSRIVGIAKSSFTAGDGKQVTGTTIYVVEPLDPKKGQGERADHYFLSAAKLGDLGFTPMVGQEVTILFNRYGKVATLKLDDPLDQGEVID